MNGAEKTKREGLIRRFTAVLIALLLCFRFFSVLTVAEDRKKTAAEAIRSGFYSFSESIDVSSLSLTPMELSSLFSSIIKDDPYLFFVNNNLSYSYTSKGYVLSLKPTYSIIGREVFVAWDLCREMVRRIARLADRYDGNAAKALFIHDYICDNFSYDPSMQSDDLYSFFLTGRGTCQSYAYAYMAVLRECGINAHYVASDAIEHIWNYVNIDGMWYHVDLTWDDTGEKVSRRHFLCSDNVTKERGHRDWYSSQNIVCDSEIYSGFNFDKLLHKDVLVGDVDHNKSVDLCDLAYFRLCFVDEEVSEYCTICADINADGVLDEADIGCLRKKLLAVD